MSKLAAAIDFGTNSFRLLIAESTHSGLKPLVNKLAQVRLGADLNKSGRLSKTAIIKGLTATADFAELINNFPDIKIRACGTAALRTATNSHEFIEPAEKLLNTNIEIILPEQEAELSLNGCLSALDNIQQPVCVIDAGGGSTEFVFQQTESKPFSFSIPLGAVNLTEQFALGLIPSPSVITDLEQYLRTITSQRLRATPPIWSSLFCTNRELHLLGTGGTATALAALDLELNEYDAHVVQGHRLTTDTLNMLSTRLCALSGANRNKLPGLDQNRGQIIIAGLKIYQVVLELSGVEKITTSDAGLLEGILLSVI